MILQCFTVLSRTLLDSLQKDLIRFEQLAESKHAPHHAADDHDHRRRETWWQAADGSQGHLRSSETLHKCPQVILGPMLSSLAPTTTPKLPKVALLHHLGHDHHVGALPPCRGISLQGHCDLFFSVGTALINSRFSLQHRAQRPLCCAAIVDAFFKLASEMCPGPGPGPG